MGTYTPFSVAYLHTAGWWIFLGCMWMFAILGFISKLFFAHRIEGVSIWIYVALGWMTVMSAPGLTGLIAPEGLWWMFIGGLLSSSPIQKI